MFRKLLISGFAAFTLAATSIGLSSNTASAEVIENEWYQKGRVLVSPCTGETITVAGKFHSVWYTTPDGHTMMRFNVRYTGTDTAGTEYIFNARQLMDHWQWPVMFPHSFLQTYDVISRGADANFRVTLNVEYDATGTPVVYVIEAVCRG